MLAETINEAEANTVPQYSRFKAFLKTQGVCESRFPLLHEQAQNELIRRWLASPDPDHGTVKDAVAARLIDEAQGAAAFRETGLHKAREQAKRYVNLFDPRMSEDELRVRAERMGLSADEACKCPARVVNPDSVEIQLPPAFYFVAGIITAILLYGVLR